MATYKVEVWVFFIKGHRVTIPSWLPRRGWSLHNKGYLIYTSRKKDSGIKRGTRCHRLVAERLLGRSLREDEDVHHNDSKKLHNCPMNLCIMPRAFNPTGAMRDPHTGEFMSIEKYIKRYGKPVDEGVPDWVTAA